MERELDVRTEQAGRDHDDPPMAKAMSYLGERIELLAEVAGLLEERLRPVLTPRPDHVVAADLARAEDAREPAPLVASVNYQANRVDDAIDRIQGLLRRIEV